MSRQSQGQGQGQSQGQSQRQSQSQSEDGSVLILIIFGAALALALTLGVAAATSLYLERKRLFTLADGAALAASESFDLATVGVRASGEGAEGAIVHPVLTNAGVALAAENFVANASHAGLDGLVISRAVTVEGRSATIELVSLWRPPVLSFFLPDGIRLEVESTARSIFY